MDAKTRAAAKQVRDMAAHEIYAEASKCGEKADKSPAREQAEIGFMRYAVGQLTQHRDELKAGPSPKEQHVCVSYGGADWQVTFDDDGDVTGYCIAGQELYDFLDDGAKFRLDELAEPLIAGASRRLAGDVAIDRHEAQRDREAA